VNSPAAGFSALPAAQVLANLASSDRGLTSAEAASRLSQFGANRLKPPKNSQSLAILIGQFKSPIILILLCATLLSFALRNHVDAIIILTIVIASGFMGFWQERGASTAVAKLLALVQIKATAVRDGVPKEIHVEDIVPGDVVVLNAGDIVPGDCLLLEAKDIFADEGTLTGETFPVEKSTAAVGADTPLAQRSNTLWMGTHVVSGTGKAVVVHTGKDTEFGRISERLQSKAPETDFERGIRRFGYLLGEVTLILVVVIFAVNVYFERPVLESFLFSLALAVGLTPQLLPAIISVNLAHGAKQMAEKNVIVKRLSAIENFGSMNILCSDKTGTLTEGVVHLKAALDTAGNPSERVFLHAYINAFYESGFTNPIDTAIRNYQTLDMSGYPKVDEIPYDFIRKRLSIVVEDGGKRLMVTKGALTNILDACAFAETQGHGIVPIEAVRDDINRQFADFSAQGFRTLGVAFRMLTGSAGVTKNDESGMTFLGFLTLFDPPKENIMETIADLRRLGVALKVITGDNRLVAQSLGAKMGLPHTNLITGSDLRQISDDALVNRVRDTDLFAEIEPNQKEKIILALRKGGNVVGYIGDGINDAAALHAADVGISVDTAADVAKDAADIVLLEKTLAVLIAGVREGRTVFANTLKYVFMATSANFGNMFSMAGLSFFVPFLPLLPKQILLTNLLTDFPEMTIATDRVDEQMIDHPRRWDIRAIRKFMVTFGLVSSVFDYLTFGLLLIFLGASEVEFRTGWFVESVVSASLIVLIIRTPRPFFMSPPGKYLLGATLATVVITLALPFTPLAPFFGFTPLALKTYAYLSLIVIAYFAVAEWVKTVFYRRVRL